MEWNLPQSTVPLDTLLTVIEALDRILPGMDKEIAQNLKMILKKRGTDIHTGARVEEILRAGDGRGLACRFVEKDKAWEVTADGILIATGRRAYTGRRAHIRGKQPGHQGYGNGTRPYRDGWES